MSDQAARLRELARQMPSSSSWGQPMLVIGSGKGGVGKSVIAVLLAHQFAQSGLKVLLLDGDFNLGNLHILLGVQPAARVETLLHGDTTPDELIVPVGENLFLLPADSGGEVLHTLGSIDRARLYHRLTSVADQYDVVIVDAGAGIESMIRCTASHACHPVVVTIPEPAALADAYAVIKIINLQIPSVSVGVIVNRVTGAVQARAAFDRLNTASEKFLQTPLHYVGALPDDVTLQEAVRQAQAFWSTSDNVATALPPVIGQLRAALALEPALHAP